MMQQGSLFSSPSGWFTLLNMLILIFSALVVPVLLIIGIYFLIRLVRAVERLADRN
jgi:hypothetical protein